MNWVLEHMEDPGKKRFPFLETKCTAPDAQSMTVPLVSSDFAEPLSVPGSGAKEKESVNEEAVGMIVSMGFTRAQAIKALKATVSIILRHYRESWKYELNLLWFAVCNSS